VRCQYWIELKCASYRAISGSASFCGLRCDQLFLSGDSQSLRDHRRTGLQMGFRRPATSDRSVRGSGPRIARSSGRAAGYYCWGGLGYQLAYGGQPRFRRDFFLVLRWMVRRLFPRHGQQRKPPRVVAWYMSTLLVASTVIFPIMTLAGWNVGQHYCANGTPPLWAELLMYGIGMSWVTFGTFFGLRRFRRWREQKRSPSVFRI
jgi:hypothetical protein